MDKISNDLSPLSMKIVITRICVPYNTRTTTKVEEDNSGQCTKRSNYKIPSTKTVSNGLKSIRHLDIRYPNFGS